MKYLPFLFVALLACSEDDTIYPVGSWSFATKEFSGTVTLSSSGMGQGRFIVDGVEYTAINANIRRGSSLIMYSEDRAYLAVHKLRYTGKSFISDYQEFRPCCQPTPIPNLKRSSPLTLTPQ